MNYFDDETYNSEVRNNFMNMLRSIKQNDNIFFKNEGDFKKKG